MYENIVFMRVVLSMLDKKYHVVSLNAEKMLIEMEKVVPPIVM